MVPVLVDDRIESRCALRHPGLTRTCAFLENQPVFPLLRNLRSAITGASLIGCWIQDGLSAVLARRILIFLVRHQVLVPAPQATHLDRSVAPGAHSQGRSRAAFTALPAFTRP
jgi:hypothetical protein